MPAAPAPPKPPVFGTGANLVQVDLIATDTDGRPVTDLSAEEIEVFEGGKRRPLELLQFVATGPDAHPSPSVAESAPLSPAATPPAPAVSGQADPAPPTGPRLVIAVDLATLPLDALVRTRRAVADMVGTGLVPGTQLMLVVLDRGLEIRQPFTSDSPRFVAAVDRLAATVGEGDSSLADLVDQVDRTCDGTPGAVANAVALARAYVEDARRAITLATEGLAALARYLAPLPGRKHVVFFSAGYAMEPAAIAASVVEGICAPPAGSPGRSYMQAGPSEAYTSVRVGAQVDAAGLLRALLDAANQAQVSVYTVDARGLVGDAVAASSRAPTRIVRRGQLQQLVQRLARDPQEILRSIGEGTGASASVNSNELTRGLRQAAADASGFYLLAYAPTGGRKEGRFYPIELKVNRPGLHLRYRRGYVWLSDASRAERALAAALRFPELFREDRLSAEPSFEGSRLTVAVVLPTRALEFRTEEGVHRCEIAVRGLLHDAQGQPVGKSYLISKEVALRLSDTRLAELRARDNVEIANVAPAPKPGRYRLTVVVRHSGGRLATAASDLVVP